MPYYPPDQVGTGTVTSITAGGGLTGGIITASGTLAVGQGTGITVNADDIANAGVLSTAAGTGISVSGTGVGPYTGAVTVTNTGVTSLLATANQTTVSGATGAVTIGVVQDIATTSSPTFLDGTFTGNLAVHGNLFITGTTQVSDAETLNVADNRIFLNAGYVTAAAQTGGLNVNYLPIALTDTVAASGFTAGVASPASPPTVVTTLSGTFSIGQIVQFSLCTLPQNNGLYEVLSHVGTLLTIRGIGSTACVEDWTQNQFATGAETAGVPKITQVNAGILRCGTDGEWEVGKGNTSTSPTGLTFNDLYHVGGLNVSPADGGTGLSTVTTGDLLYGSATNTWAALADVAVGSVLVSGGIGAVPAYSETPQVSKLGIGTAVDVDAAQLLTLVVPATLTSGNVAKISWGAATTLAGTTYVHYTDARTNVSLNNQTLYGYELLLASGSSGGNLVGYNVNCINTNYSSTTVGFQVNGTGYGVTHKSFSSALTGMSGSTIVYDFYAGAYFANTKYGFYSSNSTSTTKYGFYSETLTAGTTNVGLYLGGAAVTGISGAVNGNYTIYGDAGSYRFETDQTQASATSAYLDAFNIPASTIVWTGSTATTTTTGCNLVDISAPTYSAGTAFTMDYAATLRIGGAPIAGGAGPLAITNTYALWVDSGNVRIDGSVTDGTVTFALNTIYRTSGTDVTLADGGLNASLVASLGGIFYSTATAGAILAGDTSNTRKFVRTLSIAGVAQAPAWDTVTSSDVGLGSVENTALSTWAGTTNITTLGTVSSGTWSATTIAVNKGGTGLAVWTVGDIVHATGTTTLAGLAAVAVGQVLISGGVGVVSSYSATPILGVAGTTAGTLRLSGGTSGVVTVDVALAAGTWAFTLPTDAGAANYAMITDGSGNASWSILPVAGGGTGGSAASITLFNNITGFSAAGTTGTTSTNLVFSTSPVFVTPTLGAASATSLMCNTYMSGSYINITPAAGSTISFDNGCVQIDASAANMMSLTGGTANVISDDSGAYLNVAGTWTNAPSYRRYKDKIGDLDHVLDRIVSIDVDVWRYKRGKIEGEDRWEGDAVVHCSPYVDDFYRIFGMGKLDAQNPMDHIGVLFNAVKELKLENDSLRREVEILRSEI